MDDVALFENFVQVTLNVAVARNRQAILGFMPTFRAVLTTSDGDMDDFVKSTHGNNSRLNQNQRVTIDPSVVIYLKGLHFELKDRERCDALPDAAWPGLLNLALLVRFRADRSEYLENQKITANTKMPEVDVPKLTPNNFDEFMTHFTSAARNVNGAYGDPIDYLFRSTNGNYDAAWADRSDKLKQCTRLDGTKFKHDSALLYNLYVQYVGTDGHGGTTVKKFARSKNGYQLHHQFIAHYRDESYLERKATEAEKKLKTLHYRVERPRFTIETYYTILNGVFNDLDHAGPQYALNDEQKVKKFEGGIQNKDAMHYYILAQAEWRALPAPQRTFDRFYNIFIAKFSKYKSLSDGTSTSTSTSSARINAVNGRGGGNRGRGRGRGRGGRGRGNYHSGRGVPNFKPEARNYPFEIYRNLSTSQREEVNRLKAEKGWKGRKPPIGHELDFEGRAVPSQGLISMAQSYATSFGGSYASISRTQANTAPMPPPPSNETPPIPGTISTATAGLAFGTSSSGSRGGGDQQQAQNGNDADSVTISTVNGREYRGHIYDRNGNRIT